MTREKILLGLLSASALASVASPQTADALLKEGDTIIGMGSLETISYVQILDSRMWTAFVDTSFGDTTKDVAILRNGFVTLREGTALFSPANTVLDDFDSIHMATTGHLAMCLRVTVSGQVREALYWNTVPIALRDTILNSPLVGANTDWETFDVCKINSRNEVFVLGDVNNPANGTQRDPTLCRFTMDNVGNILSTTVLYTKSVLVPVLGTTVNDLAATEHGLSINSRGEYLTLVMGLGGANAFVLNGDTVVAQEGFESPIAGRNWQTLTNNPRLSLNDRGEYAFIGTVSGGPGNYLVMKNQTVFAQSGVVYPEFSPAPLANGTAAPVYITNDGAMFWRADSTNLNDDAFLRNFKPIVQAGVTTIDGDLVTGVEQTDNAFAVSPNGRFWVGRVDLQATGQAVLFADFGLILPLPGCHGNTAKLAVKSGFALPGQTLAMEMDDGQAAGALPFVIFSTRERIPGSDCGAVTPYGELLISTAHKVGRVTFPLWDGVNASTLNVPIPPNLSLVNRTFFAQGVFRSASAPAFALTNGLRIEIGAP